MSLGTPNDPRKTVALFAILLAVLFVVFALVFSGALGHGYKVDVPGTVTYTPGLPGLPGNWECDIGVPTQEKDTMPFTIASTLGTVDTGEILVIVRLGGDAYKGESSIGTVSSLFGGSKDFDVYLRHVDPGNYVATIEVWEVEKGLFGIGENSRNLVYQDTFNMEVFNEEEV